MRCTRGRARRGWRPLHSRSLFRSSPRLSARRRRSNGNIPVRGGAHRGLAVQVLDRKSTRLNSSHSQISYAVFCLKKKKNRKASLDEFYDGEFSRVLSVRTAFNDAL